MRDDEGIISKDMVIKTSICIYWLFCFIAMMLIITNRKYIYSLLNPSFESPDKEKGYKVSLLLGWIVTLAASGAYISFTRKYETGNYEIIDLIVFSVFNGILEQFMFIFWFFLGCYIGKIISSSNNKLIFTLGYISYAMFSGIIHALFWIKVLPSHEPAIIIMPVFLSIMSLVWMWLVWRYRAVMAIIIMHMFIDFITVGHLNFAWFESFQIIGL
ncbi:MAG: hypothetical protein KME28_04075 [Pelatocladus maniniholoensis HA4357-MV3]|uniref:Uncharacterized protein n=1 Tax=Pelatocladus maniniholoensis HA4357-MV3 TaxID=1117104 RepID=A0A9E3H4V7_9NOST|nr:hypothetical protein [Pelatocladus maniniholoensis HA4357-MV3]